MKTVSALLTDLYELSMLQVYWKKGMHGEAVFEFYTRSLPPHRGFLIAAGLEQCLDYLENLGFTDDELEFLRADERFHDDFVDWLAEFRFSGDVHAMSEGTIFFPNEPILRVTAPLPQAQLVETRLINLLQFQSLVATKAARVVLAAPEKQLIDFGQRRAHGAEAALLAARAAFIAGFTGTSNVLAEQEFEIPSFGTMAHSFIQAHDNELDAFRNFAEVHRGPVVFLIDTYDTEAAAQLVVELAPSLKREGVTIAAVRIDSGDLAAHAVNVRKILDKGGLADVGIFASGGLDEEDLRLLVSSGAPIDGFGVGTKLDTSADAPYLDCAYKLVEYDGKPRFKKSEGKVLLPGPKQVYRRVQKDHMLDDVVTLAGSQEAGEPLLQKVMAKGKRIEASGSLESLRQHTAEQLRLLPAHLRQLKTDPPYPVSISDAVRNLAKSI